MRSHGVPPPRVAAVYLMSAPTQESTDKARCLFSGAAALASSRRRASALVLSRRWPIPTALARLGPEMHPEALPRPDDAVNVKVYTCIHVCGGGGGADACVYAFAYALLRACVYTYAYACAHAYAYAHVHVCEHACAYILAFLLRYVHAHVHLYTYHMCLCPDMHLNTYL